MPLLHVFQEGPHEWTDQGHGVDEPMQERTDVFLRIILEERRSHQVHGQIQCSFGQHQSLLGSEILRRLQPLQTERNGIQ